MHVPWMVENLLSMNLLKNLKNVRRIWAWIYLLKWCDAYFSHWIGNWVVNITLLCATITPIHVKIFDNFFFFLKLYGNTLKNWQRIEYRLHVDFDRFNTNAQHSRKPCSMHCMSLFPCHTYSFAVNLLWHVLLKSWKVCSRRSEYWLIPSVSQNNELAVETCL